MAITQNTVFFQFDANSRTRFFWHLEDNGVVRCNHVTIATRKNLRRKTFHEMNDAEKARICRKCLGMNSYKTTLEKKKAYAEGRIVGLPRAPLCPYCNGTGQVACSEAKGNRLSWWQEGRKWKCFGCGKRFDGQLKEL